MALDQEEVQRMKDEANRGIRKVLEELNGEYPEAVAAAASAVGATLGGAASYAALYFGGITGLSAAGITSGLAFAGALVGGGMVAGTFVLAAPVAVLGIAGYAIARNRKKARQVAALRKAIKGLYQIQERLMQNAEYFRKELAVIKASMEKWKSMLE